MNMKNAQPLQPPWRVVGIESLGPLVVCSMAVFRVFLDNGRFQTVRFRAHVPPKRAKERSHKKKHWLGRKSADQKKSVGRAKNKLDPCASAAQ
jgi:hypothetical protein